ncbi:hypothetical protein NM688_g9242 [Phlebia brevispora]|uniref:Uncharacterized protein n=1 Tax=Phlebia brevispora TaxID=194682 RepID=A0ACC1RJ25_9APHY|nr:hypothetical protein NM688_g9242 [Phlebia brevispora]
MRFDVRWQPQDGTLGVPLKYADTNLLEQSLSVDAGDLDVEALLRSVIKRHTKIILTEFQRVLQTKYGRIFGAPGEVVLITDDDKLALQICLCADEIVILTVDPRTGRLTLRDTGDLAAAGRGSNFNLYTNSINDNPLELGGLLARLRFQTIVDIAEQKANYLGLRNFRERNFSAEETQKLGADIHGKLYIQLGKFPNHYLALLVAEDDFRYALIQTKDTMYNEMIMEDIARLDVQRVHGADITVRSRAYVDVNPPIEPKRKGFPAEVVGLGPLDRPFTPRFNLDTQVLRELYSYCCARVAYTKVEQQLKTRGLPYSHVNSLVNPSPELSHVHSSLARSIPALCVQSSDILSGAPAAEAAMPNIRVIPLNWWSERKQQVATCVKLKYVQQPVGKRAGGAIIRPSKRIIYDTREAVVTFLAEDVDKCVDEFLEEWAKVSKMVVIAREVAQMATAKRWHDVRLLSFDLQTVEFAYSGDYAVSITCTDQLSPTGGSYELHFSRVVDESAMDTSDDGDINQMMATYNPHEDIEPFVRNLMRHGRLAESLHRLVALLRDTLPIVSELEYIRLSASKAGDKVDTYAKTAGWYRVLFGDLRHALDFRLMSHARVLILDASNTLFPLPAEKAIAAPQSDGSLALQPIPKFNSLVQATCRDVAHVYRGSKVTPVDTGIICESGAVRMVGRTLYEKVRQALKETTSSPVHIK